MNTDYNLYKIFLYLYEEKSISKTANKLYVSQPAISYSLKELENQLGYTLFYRNSKGIEPTEEAKELYGYISTAFNILNEAEDHLKKLSNLNIGCIKIGMTSQINMSFLADYIAKFQKKYPGVKFEIITKTTSEMMAMLENKSLDLVIDALPITSKKDVKKVILTELNNCFVYNKNKYKKVNIESLEDLTKYDLILPSYDTSVRSKIDEYMESKNVKINSLIEADTSEIIMEMTYKGLGIGYLTKNLVEQSNNEDLEILDFNNDLPVVDICCVYVEDFLTTATKKFVELLNAFQK